MYQELNVLFPKHTALDNRLLARLSNELLTFGPEQIYRVYDDVSSDSGSVAASGNGAGGKNTSVKNQIVTISPFEYTGTYLLLFLPAARNNLNAVLKEAASGNIDRFEAASSFAINCIISAGGVVLFITAKDCIFSFFPNMQHFFNQLPNLIAQPSSDDGGKSVESNLKSGDSTTSNSNKVSYRPSAAGPTVILCGSAVLSTVVLGMGFILIVNPRSGDNSVSNVFINRLTDFLKRFSGK